MDPQKSPKPEPWAMGSFWVMQQSPPCSLPSSEAAELGLCAGKELLVKKWLPGNRGCPWSRYSLCKHNTYLRAGAMSRGGRGVQDAVPEVTQPDVTPSLPEFSRRAPSPGLCPGLGRANTEPEDGCWMASAVVQGTVLSRVCCSPL